MSEQILPNLLKSPHENRNDKPKVLPVIGEAKLYQISKRPAVPVDEPEDDILDSEFVE